MQKITPHQVWPLHSCSDIRVLEKSLAKRLDTDPSHPSLMESAGLSVARLCLALAPDAKHIWIACGPGNNGGDGLISAIELQKMGKTPYVTLCGTTNHLPDQDSHETTHSKSLFNFRNALESALNCGIQIQSTPPKVWDIAVDALLGIGVSGDKGGDLNINAKSSSISSPNSLQARPIEGVMADWLVLMFRSAAPVLCVDIASGLNPETGVMCKLKPSAEQSVDSRYLLNPKQKRYTLTFLGLKAGLFTGSGKDFAGEIWFDSLTKQNDFSLNADAQSDFFLNPYPLINKRLQDTHKGTYSDVAVIGGGEGMQGAALLAATSALHMGSGRVYAYLLSELSYSFNINPALMIRKIQEIKTLDLKNITLVCGCGGGGEIKYWLTHILENSTYLVLDADALNAIARDNALKNLLKTRSARQMQTIVTPHPLEAARLLGIDTVQVQSNRIQVAKEIARSYNVTVVLKGSGTVIATEYSKEGVAHLCCKVCINVTGNPLLSSAGTGDVLAGMIGSIWAHNKNAWNSACTAVFQHGLKADEWPEDKSFDAELLAQQVSYPRQSN